MNRVTLLLSFLVFSGCACWCCAGPVPVFDLKGVVESSGYVYVCQIDRIRKEVPTREQFESGEHGRLDLHCTVLAAFKGEKLQQIRATLDLHPHGPSVELGPLNTNNTAIFFLRRSDESEQFTFADRWYPAIRIQQYYPDRDSETWDVNKRILTQLKVAAESEKPDEIRCGLHWLNELKQTASQVSEKRLWELASSEDYDVQILALKALVQSGNRKAIEQAVRLAIKISKDKSKVDRENLGSLLWYIAGRFSSKVSKNLAEELSRSSDPIVGGAGKDILKRR